MVIAVKTSPKVDEVFLRRTQFLPASAIGAPGGFVDVHEIPDARAIADNDRFTGIERNRAITGAYTQIARVVQARIDPEFARTGQSSLLPNWFAVGASASSFVGHAIAGAEEARDVLLVEPALSRADVLDGVGIEGPARPAAQVVAQLFDNVLGARVTDALLAFLWRIAGKSLSAFLDPRLASAVAQRLVRLVVRGRDDDDRDSLHDHALALFSTIHALFTEGNRAIIADIGALAQDALAARDGESDEVARRHGAPLALVDDVHRWGRDEAEGYGSVPTDIKRAFPDAGSDDGTAFSLAALRLYEDAGRSIQPRVHARLVAIGNNLLAHREQHDVVHPCFQGRRDGQLDRNELLLAFTPVIALFCAGEVWTMADFAKRAGAPVETGRMARLLSSARSAVLSPAAAYNWSVFPHRFAAIMDSFDVAYEKPEAVWTNLPNPDPRAA